ncbi:DUF6065 family protein [Sinorhizobium prairiense]|uniref:DUF6065 family protein n=1 Tax=unclassified Sinorhizobium TaxID=2613772 RepID=UPI0023D8AF33|nr:MULTISPECIES: DUF6065 family protein [unclassified Sinorhizobium]WEJ13696.1 DUF6065 family protein [Sinorhizobium sp. M103]WEJ19160.1 DUF6065 family protein [Sinorhizobium sp. K101]WEJ40104.1 DUF6065 family protein [Sinorhizobium sp. C101]
MAPASLPAPFLFEDLPIPAPFHIPCQFVTGTVEQAEGGITALTDIIGTDWSPCTFTMKWQFTRAGQGVVRSGEPTCHIFPVSCGGLAVTGRRIIASG